MVARDTFPLEISVFKEPLTLAALKSSGLILLGSKAGSVDSMILWFASRSAKDTFESAMVPVRAAVFTYSSSP